MPTLISTPQDLNNVRNNLSGNYELSNDIDMSDWGNFKPIGDLNKKFTGSFDGKGFKITNLSINELTTYIGLFGFVEGATIQNVAIENANVTSNSYNYVGILVGYVSNGTIRNSYTTGQVSGQYGVGGLVGWHASGIIENCYSHANTTGSGRVGGLLGNGVSFSSIVNKSYSTGLVTTDLYNGGLIGSHADSTKVTNSYYDSETSGQTISAGGMGKSTSEMKTQSIYTNWDFTSTWGIDNSYPYLQVFGMPQTPAKIETISIKSHVLNIDSTVYKSSKSTKQTQSHIDTVQMLSKRYIATIREMESYLSPIHSNVQKSTRSVKSSTETVVSFINPISASVERQSKTFQYLISHLKPLQVDLSVLYPLTNKLVNAYVSVLENPSSVSTMDNMTNVSYIVNPSNVEVIE